MILHPSKRLESLPVYAFKAINDRVDALKKQGIEPIDFGVGDPSEPTPNFVIEALAVGAKKHARSGYPSYSGSSEFRQACADYMHRRFGVQLNPETEISSNIGSKESIFHFPEAFLEPGDVVIIPSPGYPPMKMGTMCAEGIPYFVPLFEQNHFLIDFRAIPEEVCRKAKILWLNYPNSPTGAVANRLYYEELIQWAHKWNILLAADEGCYIDLYFGEPPLSILEVARKGILTFYSLSKRNNMTGYRVGFVAGDEKIVNMFKKLKTHIDSGTPDFIQEAAIAALNDDTHAASMRNLYEKKTDRLIAVLNEVGLKVEKPKATFYIWAKVPGGDDVAFAQRLLEADVGIVVTPGSLISERCDGSVNPGAGYVRFALMPSLEQIEEAGKRLKNS